MAELGGRLASPVNRILMRAPRLCITYKLPSLPVPSRSDGVEPSVANWVAPVGQRIVPTYPVVAQIAEEVVAWYSDGTVPLGVVERS